MHHTHPAPPDPRDQELAALRAENDQLRHEAAALHARVAALEAEAATNALDLAIGHTLRTQLPDTALFVFDSDLRYLAIEGMALEEAGIPLDHVDHMVGQPIQAVVPPAAWALLEGPYRAAVHGEPAALTGPFGTAMYRSDVLPVRNTHGQLVAGVALVRNITAQVMAEHRMRMFEELVEHAPDGIFVRQEDRTIVYANPAMETLIGHAPLVGGDVGELIAPEDRPQMAAIGTQLDVQSAWSGRLVYQRADGTTFAGQAAVFPVTDAIATVPLIGAIVRDVSGAEQAAQQQQAEILAAQQAMIRELATPLIPLADAVIAMPLVGTIDSGRAQQVMETLLEGIVTHQAEHAILDITGVKVVDTQVAQALVRIAQAAKLLGAQILVSGIGAEIALTLTQLNADLTGLTPVANLQQAIAYAMDQEA